MNRLMMNDDFNKQQRSKHKHQQSQQQRFIRLKNIDGNNKSKKNESTPSLINNNNNNCGDKDLIKVVIIGESGSGKSNLIQRLVNNHFDERSPSTIGIDFALYEFESNSIKNVNERQHYQAQIWDTAGMERYRSSITNIFYRDVNGALLVFDITRSDHFEALPKWLREIRRNVANNNDNECNERQEQHCQIPIILVGNKIDLHQHRQIDRNDAIKYAQKYHLANYIETSAKNSINVHEAFQQLFDHIIESKQIEHRHQINQQQMMKSNKKSKYSARTKANNGSSNVQHNASIKLTRDQYYLEQRAKLTKEKKKSNCSC